MRGFTIIELLVVLAIFLVLVAIITPMAINFYKIEMLNKAESQLVWLLREAHDNAVNQKNNSFFGVKVLEDNFVLFRGESFADRIEADDHIVFYSDNIKIFGDDEIVFVPTTGFVKSEAVIELISVGVSKEINVNKIGVINY